MIGLQKVSLKIHMQMRSWGFGTDFTETWWYFLQMSTPDVHNVRAIKLRWNTYAVLSYSYVICDHFYPGWPLSILTSPPPGAGWRWPPLVLGTRDPSTCMTTHSTQQQRHPAWACPLSVLGPAAARSCLSLHWRQNDHDGVSNHQPHGCLLKRLFRRRSKKTSKLRVTGLCAGNSPGPGNSPHKGPVTRKMVPFDDVIMS